MMPASKADLQGEIHQATGQVVGHRILIGCADVHDPEITGSIAYFQQIECFQRDADPFEPFDVEQSLKTQIQAAVG